MADPPPAPWRNGDQGPSHSQPIMENNSKDSEIKLTEVLINKALLDPPKWGWTAAAGVADLLPPHERARRKEGKGDFLKRGRKRDWRAAFSCAGAETATGSFSDGKRGSPMEAVANGSKISISREAPAVFGSEVQNDRGTDDQINMSTHHPRSIADIQSTQQDFGKESTSSSVTNSRLGSNIQFKDSENSGQCDIYVYHRGREGQEVRDEVSGELVCEVDATDTGFGLDAPRAMAEVMISIPLCDGTEHSWKDITQWDLSDPSTATPMMFAMKAAESFGLSFAQTLDLSESIQSQLNEFVCENCATTPVLTMAGAEWSDKIVPCVPSLYGGVTGIGKEGMVDHKTKIASKANIIARTRSREIGVGKAPAKTRRSLKAPGAKADPRFLRDLVQRLEAASAEEIGRLQEKDGSHTEDNIRKEGFCHLCRDGCGLCVSFGCGAGEHALCADHAAEKLGIVLSTEISSLHHCPICSLSCDCKYCEERLSSVAATLKQAVDDGGLPIESIPLKELLATTRNVNLNVIGKTAGSKSKVRQKIRQDPIDRPTVPKVPRAEFPREICKGVDVDVGNDILYSTVFTNEGQLPAEDLSPHAAMIPEVGLLDQTTLDQDGPVVEDGSVDYCNTCGKVGNLLCCDFCPRAFHRECVEASDSAETWECPVCRQEKLGFPEDHVHGEENLSKICEAYDDPRRGQVREALDQLRALSIIYEMLERLMKYDFGYVFSSPVDLKAVPNYAEIVKNPIDLGTISTNLISGAYGKLVETSSSLESVVLEVLKDIELVWHNCFTFNCEGSAVYRMAEVQRRRANAIRKTSFESLLSADVREKLAEYCRERQRERDEALGRSTRFTRISSFSPPKSRNKITVSDKKGNGRPVAVFDPDTGMIVKIYSTAQAACTAVTLFLNLKFECEWTSQMIEVDTTLKVRKIIKDSPKDPGLLLFGYRWLPLEDLKGNKVIFKPSKVHAEKKIKDDAVPVRAEQISNKVGKVEVSRPVKVVDGERTYLFRSLEESLCFFDNETDLAQLRNSLSKLEPGIEHKDTDGRKWCLLPINGSSKITKATIVKEDLISGCSLVGFSSLDGAYQDWIKSCDASPVFSEDTPSLEMFQKFYLDGDRNVDGIVWKTRGGTNADEWLDKCSPGKMSEKLNGTLCDVQDLQQKNGSRVETKSFVDDVRGHGPPSNI